ncbi:3-oxoacyl-ACP reductase [Streptomyces radicis]|uniref:3-oxoacyl-ACP reductase n=1 Tax=Streptomyces radicis TaxID=1750517 RepID=A0A3A9VUI2_9ACTN|nr:3-oxoacyl-ACP reductase [Streptomyces radicis]RKN03833.1 3-oxoacyl-ACP reductase [Streptomyces radicis]RKN13928.1 3-oxoacyl-ACP reductase [Streptomyces radicis]
MADRYLSFVTSRPGAFLARRLGLPRPAPLARHHRGRPVLTGPVELGEGEHARVATALRAVLASCGATVEPGAARPAALVYDATGIRESRGLGALHAFLGPRVRSLAPCGRVLVVGTPPELTTTPRERAAQRALEGFVRSLAKELRGGSTAHLLHVAPGAEEFTESTVRFLLSARSAYVSGQVVRLDPPAVPSAAARPADWERPLDGRTALVTGAARGIGAAVAEVLHREGARVVCLDVPGAAEPLNALADRLGGTAVPVDITARDADARIEARVRDAHGGGLDILVHNAGITRDRTLARMPAEQWNAVIDVNLTAVERLTAALAPLLRDGGRVVATSSVNGLAGAAGQTNYAASKAGSIGLVQALAPLLAPRGITANAVAPGFIATGMTAAMPFPVRTVAARLNSLGQPGRPVDVAEAVAWLASPGSGAVTGHVLRVCGQSLVGA